MESIKVENLTQLWDKLFDHFYVLWMIDRPEHKERFMTELERVGIVQTGKMEIFENCMTPIKKRILEKTFNSKWVSNNWPDGLKNLDTAYQHYLMMNDAQFFKYNRILIIEDDVTFLKSLDDIYTILSTFPEDCNICLFDRLLANNQSVIQSMTYEDIISNSVEINENYREYRHFNGNWTGALYAIDGIGRNFIIDAQQNKMLTSIDEILVTGPRNQGFNDDMKLCFSNKILGIQLGNERHELARKELKNFDITEYFGY